MNSNKKSKQAVKLLGGHEGQFLWGDMGIRQGEYDGISHERLMEFIEVYPVYNVTIDHNNYGEFQFITLKAIQYRNDGSKMYTSLQFWGNGYHEYRESMVVNWRINVNSWYSRTDGEKPLNKADVIKQIEARRESMGIRKDTKQESSGNLFSTIADLTDDDFAMVNDMGIEF